jgi:hypothetical protein
MTPIRADLLAAKLKAARTGEEPQFAAQLEQQPRLAELLWFLQAASLQPHGLIGLAERLVKSFPEQFQTEAMLASGVPEKNGCYSFEQCLKVWIGDGDSERFWRDSKPADYDHIQAEKIGYEEFLGVFVGPEVTPNHFKGNSVAAHTLNCSHKRFNLGWLKARCQGEARSKLPTYLEDLCQTPSVCLEAKYCCPGLNELLFNFMDQHALETSAKIAETVITKTVFRELEFAYTERVPVPIVGESRFGKTKSVSTYCEMYPGRARLVTVPESNREADFIRAHADAFGIDYTPGAPILALKDKVEFVVRHAGVMLVYDEFHFAVPISYHKTTPPRRLNWVRTKVIDQGVRCAFFATPQSYDQTLDKYVKTTGYRVEQWLGRLAPPVLLSDVIPFEEIIAVARIHFPEMAQNLLEEMADRAIISDGHLKNLELAGHRARFLARERSHPKPTIKDVVDACEEMMPTEPRLVTEHAPVSALKSVRRTATAAAVAMRGQPPEDQPEGLDDNDFPRRKTVPSRHGLEAVNAA